MTVFFTCPDSTLDDVRGDANQVAEPLEAADDDPRRAETPADIDRERLVQLRVRAEVAERVEDAGPPDDGEAVDALQIRAHRLRDTRSNPVVDGLARDVGERHHGNGVVDAAGTVRQARRDAARGAARCAIEVARESTKVITDLAGRLVPERRGLLERVRHDGVEAAGNLRVVARGRRRNLVKDVIDDLGRRSPGKGHPAGRELEEHDAEREDVGPVIDRMAECLLGGHVGDGAEHHPGDRDLLLRDLRVRTAIFDELREPEIEHLDEASVGPHQVCALDVAVNDAARVRFVEGVGHLQADFQRVAQRERTVRDPLRKELAFHVLHDDEIRAAVLADVVGDGDVGRSEHRRGARFGQQPGAALGIRLEPVRQELQRHLAPETDVFRAIHLAHPAGAKPAIDPIVLHGLADDVFAHEHLC